MSLYRVNIITRSYYKTVILEEATMSVGYRADPTIPMEEKEDKRQSEPIMYLPKIPTQVSTLHTNTPTGSLTTNSDCLTRSGSLKHRSAGSALKQIQISKRSTHEKPKSVIPNHSVTQIKLQNVKETNRNPKKRISNSLICFVFPSDDFGNHCVATQIPHIPFDT